MDDEAVVVAVGLARSSQEPRSDFFSSAFSLLSCLLLQLQDALDVLFSRVHASLFLFLLLSSVEQEEVVNDPHSEHLFFFNRTFFFFFSLFLP